MELEQPARPGRPRSEAAKRAILRAALALLKKHGVTGVTAEAVAERARVSKATLYRWWPCGAAIAMDAFFEEVFSRVPSPMTDEPVEDLRARARFVAKLLGGSLGDVLAGLIAATHTDPRLAEIFHERYLRPSREQLRRVVDRLVDAGALRDDIDREVLIDVICGAYYYRKLVRHEDTSPRRMDEIMACVLDGLVPRPGVAARRGRAPEARAAAGAGRGARRTGRPATRAAAKAAKPAKVAKVWRA